VHWGLGFGVWGSVLGFCAVIVGCVLSLICVICHGTGTLLEMNIDATKVVMLQLLMLLLFLLLLLMLMLLLLLLLLLLHSLTNAPQLPLGALSRER